MRLLFQSSRTRFRALLDEVPDVVLAHRSLAELLIRQGRRVEAAKHLGRLCRLGDVEERELRQLLMIVHPFAGDAASRSMSSLSGADEKQLLSEIARDRTEQFGGKDERATRQFLLCGVDLSAFAVKERDHAVPDSQP